MSVMLASTLIGVRLSSKLGGRVAELEAVLHMLEELSVQIRYRALPVYELLERLRANSSLQRLRFIDCICAELEGTRDFDHAWQQGVARSVPQSSMNKDDIEVLLAIGSSLGKSDIDGQLSAIELHSATVRARLQQASEERAKKGKLYRSLGVLAGIGISIMLI